MFVTDRPTGLPILAAISEYLEHKVSRRGEACPDQRALHLSWRPFAGPRFKKFLQNER
jgi:hypothetical protein